MSTRPLSLTERELEAMPAGEVLRWAAAEWGERLCLTCSWQKQSSVLVHMVSELELDVDIVELDTHLFFKESYETRERLVERYGLTLIVPDVITVAEQHKREGPNLWESNPDRCCHIRKVEPLIQALEPYDAWVSGIRREQSPSRAGARKVAGAPPAPRPLLSGHAATTLREETRWRPDEEPLPAAGRALRACRGSSSIERMPPA